MLVESELKWLGERELLTIENEAWYSCAYCDKFKPNYRCYEPDCPVDDKFGAYEDAAEFEARVAKKLAEETPFIMRLGAIKDNDFVIDSETALMLARLDVEEKMEGE